PFPYTTLFRSGEAIVPRESNVGVSRGPGTIRVRPLPGRLRTLFERFTDRARRVVVLAQEEARSLNHNYIGTEHILLGLLDEGEGVAAQALRSLGRGLDADRVEVGEHSG